MFYSNQEDLLCDNHSQAVNDKVNSYYNECKSNYHDEEKIYVNKKLVEDCIDELFQMG